MTSGSVANPYGISRHAGWSFTTLGELANYGTGFIQTGPFGSQLHARDYKDDGIPVVMPQQLGDNIISTDGIARISETDRDRLSRHVMQVGDIVFSRRGDVTRRAYIGPEEAGWMCGTGCLLIRVRHDDCDNRFLARFFSLPQFKAYITQKAVGATMPNLNQGILSAIPLVLPPRSAQQEIVGILSAYDDLLENNTRRIKLLEDTARRLYEEWFVRLRFPGHEHTPIHNGMPDGWTRKRIEEVCDTVGGGTPSTKVGNYWDGDITWIVPTDVTRNDCLVLLDSARKITESGLRTSSAKMVPPETILMTSRASVGFFALMDHEVCTNQGFINVIPHEEVVRMYMLFNLMSRVEEIRANAKGSTYPEISKGRFRDMDVVVPPAPLLKEFSAFASDAIKQARCLKKQNQKLQQARDLLLPRLMSGEIAV